MTHSLRELVILTTGRISKSRLKEMLRCAQHNIRRLVNIYIIAYFLEIQTVSYITSNLNFYICPWYYNGGVMSLCLYVLYNVSRRKIQ